MFGISCATKRRRKDVWDISNIKTRAGAFVKRTGGRTAAYFKRLRTNLGNYLRDIRYDIREDLERRREKRAKDALYRKATEPFWMTLVLLQFFWLPPLLFGVGPKLGIHIGDWTLYYGFLLSLPLVAYIVASYRRVQTYEVGGVMVLEKPAKELEPGWHFVPLWLAELHTYPIGRLQKQYPAEPELIFKGEDNLPLPPGMVREIRVTTAAPKAATPGTDDVLNVQKVISVTFFVVYRIANRRFFDFYTKIPGESWPEKREYIERLIRDSAETDIVEKVSNYTLGEVLSQITTINTELKKCVQENVESFGIEIIDVKMQNPDISRDLATALNEIPIANARAKATVTNAEAAAHATKVTAQADAEAIEVKAAAKGKGQRIAADAMSMDPAEYRAGEVAVESLSQNAKYFVGEGVGSIVDFAKVAKRA